MRRRLILSAAPVAVLIGATSAMAAWTAHANGTATAQALSVPQVTGVNAADGTGSSVITWTAASFGPGVTGYKVQRYTDSTTNGGQTAVCSSALTSTAVTCTDSPSTAGTYYYSVTALYKPTGVSWSGAESTRDSAVVSASATPISVTSISGGSATNNGQHGQNYMWGGTITVTVRDSSNNAVSDATVSGAWTYTTSGSSQQGTGTPPTSCVTDATGSCSIAYGNGMQDNVTSATLTVNTVSKSGTSYTSPTPKPSATINHP